MSAYEYKDLKINIGLLNSIKTRDCIEVLCTNCNHLLARSKKSILSSIKGSKLGIFCNNKCFMKYKNKDIIKILNCETCEKEVRRTPSQIVGRVFCSSSCAAKINNIGKRRHPPRTCKKCSKEYITNKNHRSLKLCIECKEKHFIGDQAKLMTVKDYQDRDSVKNKHPSWKAAHIRTFNRSWNKDLINKPCQYCGYSNHIELCHIKAVSSFSETATLGEINDPSNILVLCPNHHWEFDKGMLKLEDIPAR